MRRTRSLVAPALLALAFLLGTPLSRALAQGAPSTQGQAPGVPPQVLAPPPPPPPPRQMVLPPPADQAPGPLAAPGDDVVAPDAATLQRQIAQILVQEHVPGAAIALASSKQTLLVAGFGLADPATSREVRPSTPFTAGPLSPLFVALAALRVAALEEQAAKMDPHHHEEGSGDGAHPPGAEEKTHTETFQSPLRLPLDAAKLGLSNPFTATAPLRLENLLEQTAGLEDLAPRDLVPAEGFNPPLLPVLGLRERVLRWPPGSRFAPSRTSFTAAALQLELWSSSSFAAVVEAEVTRPLGLSCTSFRPGPEQSRELAAGHLRGKLLPALPRLHWPAQGLVTCAADLATLLRLFLERGRSEAGELHGQQLVPAAMIDRMRAGASVTLPPGVVLSGLGTRAQVLDGYLGSGQGGASEGSSAELFWFAREGLGYAVLLSAESPVALARVAAVTRRFLLRQSPRVTPPPRGTDALVLAPGGAPGAVTLEQVAGVWTQLAPATELGRILDEVFGFAILQVSGTDALSYSFSLGPEQRLLPQGRGVLRFDGDPVPSAGLLLTGPGEGGRLRLVTPDGTFEKAFAPWVFLRLALLGAALLALLSSVLFALFWVPRALFGELKQAPDLRQRALPALAAVVLLEWLLLWARGNQGLGEVNLTTVLLATLGLVYAALALAGLLDALFPKAAASQRSSAGVSVPGAAIQVQVEGQAGAPKPQRAAPAVPTRAARAVRAFCLTVSLLAVFLACELAAYGLLGVRTWK